MIEQALQNELNKRHLNKSNDSIDHSNNPNEKDQAFQNPARTCRKGAPCKRDGRISLSLVSRQNHATYHKEKLFKWRRWI